MSVSDALSKRQLLSKPSLYLVHSVIQEAVFRLTKGRIRILLEKEAFISHINKKCATYSLLGQDLSDQGA